jgi:hypothetical protein
MVLNLGLKVWFTVCGHEFELLVHGLDDWSGESTSLGFE